MANIYEISANGPERPVGFHQSYYESSGPHYVMGDTLDEAKKALEAYLGKGWTANSAKDMKALNSLPLEQRILVLAELGKKIIKKDGKAVEFETILVPKI